MKGNEGSLRQLPVPGENQVVSVGKHAALARVLYHENKVLGQVIEGHVLGEQRDVTPEVKLGCLRKLPKAR